MKNKAKKSKRVEIECVPDLIDELVGVEEKLNEKLSYANASGEVRVEQGVGVVNVLSSGKVIFSVSVNDANAHAAYKPLRNALERAFNAIMPAVEEPSVIVDELPSEPSADGHPEKFKEELEKLAGMANERLMERLGDVKDVVINFTYDGEDTIVRSGQTELIVLHGHSTGAIKKAKSIVWPKVDELKRTKKNVTSQPKTDVGSTFADKVSEIVDSANEKLKLLGEAPIEVESDSVGVYLTEGKMPICSAPKGVGSAADAFDKIKSRVDEFMRSVVGVVDRRKQNLMKSEEIETSSAWDLAMLQKVNPEIDKSEAFRLCPNADTASAIVDAAKKAARAFNESIRFKFDNLEDALGCSKARRMSVKGFTRGVVVKFGEDPVFVSTFPLVSNNSKTEETVAYVLAAISSIGEGRVKLYERISAEQDRQQRMRALASEMDSIKAEIASMAM